MLMAYLNNFYLLANINNTLINMDEQKSVQVPTFNFIGKISNICNLDSLSYCYFVFEMFLF